MKLATKFNLVLISVLLLSNIITGYFVYRILKENARHQVLQHANIMLETALAVRGYTVNEIRPLLSDKMQHEFLPQSVPAYAASQSLNQLQAQHPEYSYKEATLNPTNPKNRAVDWETDLIQTFQSNKELKSLHGIRTTPTGQSLYLAKPIVIKNQNCLVCHSEPAQAPKTMLVRYGSLNGFGWKLNDVVGAQIVSVPVTVPYAQAFSSFIIFMSTITGIYIFIIIALNIMLRSFFIKPITKIAAAADQISLGDLTAPEFAESGNDEVSTLAISFNRMRRSLEKAINIIDRGS